MCFFRFFLGGNAPGWFPVRNPSNHQTLVQTISNRHDMTLVGQNCLKKELPMRNLCLVCFLVQFPYVCY